jgi:DNA-binding MarR family transcriptional regulator
MKPPVSRTSGRAALLEQLETAQRLASAQGVLFGQAVSERMGIAGSDLECLDILQLEGRVTAGRLAEATGLTTGAITGVVDRLEKAGLVRRERDETDRRKVFVVINPANVAEIGKFYESMQRMMHKNWSAYTDDELRLLLRFANESHATLLAVTAELKTMVGPKEKKPRG